MVNMWLFRYCFFIVHLQSLFTLRVTDPYPQKLTSGSATAIGKADDRADETNNNLKNFHYSNKSHKDKHFLNDFADDSLGVEDYSVSFENLIETDFINNISGELDKSDKSEISMQRKMKPCMAPNYMVNIYRRFSSDRRYSGPAIIRSYVNLYREDSSHNSKGSLTRKHILVFNISGIETGETIQHAQLRLHTILKKHSNRVGKIIRKISIWELKTRPNRLKEAKVAIGRRSFQGPKKSGWHIFSLTKQVIDWVKSGTQIHILQVEVDIVKRYGKLSNEFDIDTKPSCDREPLLVVFSDSKNNKNAYESIKLENKVKHNNLPIMYNDNLFQSRTQFGYLRNVTSLRRKRGLRKAKRKRKYKRNICRKRRRYIDFQEIGWHSWVIAPKGYLANECVGKCYFPIPSHLTPTKYAIIKTLLHLHRRDVPSADCVPTTMAPISILYIDKGAIVYQYAFQGMVVKECGCR